MYHGPINIRHYFLHPLLAWSGHVVPVHHGCTCKDTLFLSVLHHYRCIRVRACANISRIPVQKRTCTLLVRWMHSHPAAEKFNVQHAPKSLCLKKKNQNAPRPSEHSPVRGEKMSKRLVGGIKGCKYKTSSWHLNGFPDRNNIGSTV